MNFQRRILHHGPHPDGTPQILSLSALRSCWFDLHRQGGCGIAQLVLADDFEQRDLVQLGDWISFESTPGDRWYLGRVEERKSEVPSRIRYRLEGMAIELNQIFPGGFGVAADGRNPHRYGQTDMFPLDPDHDQETADFAGTAEAVVRLLLTQYVVPGTRIRYVPEQVENPAQVSPITTLKVRGEESVRSLMKDLALRAQSAAWGVDAQGVFFFLRPRTSLLATYQEQVDLTSLSETRDLEMLYNRLLLTGDYVYNRREMSGDLARKVYRWRCSYYEPESCRQFGDRRLKIWLPWVRTQADSRAFAREFFRAYSQPTRKFFIETTGQSVLPLPWLGQVRLLDRRGEELARSRIETVRVMFDHIPRFRMELGPEDPRTLWPEPPHDERWELPNEQISGGGGVTLPSDLPQSSGGGGGGLTDSSSAQSISSSSTDDRSNHSVGSEGSEGSSSSLSESSSDWHSVGSEASSALEMSSEGSSGDRSVHESSSGSMGSIGSSNSSSQGSSSDQRSEGSSDGLDFSTSPSNSEDNSWKDGSSLESLAPSIGSSQHSSAYSAGSSSSGSSESASDSSNSDSQSSAERSWRSHSDNESDLSLISSVASSLSSADSSGSSDHTDHDRSSALADDTSLSSSRSSEVSISDHGSDESSDESSAASSASEVEEEPTFIFDH